MSLLHLAILLPFISAIVVPIVRQVFPRVHTGWFVLAVPLALFVFLFSYVTRVPGDDPLLLSADWLPTLGISFTVYLDGLSMLMGLIITGVGLLVVLYSIYYMSKEREALHNFYVYLLMFMGAMMGVVLSDNMLVLYVFWELTSIASFLLIAYWYQRKKSRYGAQKALIITVFGGLAMFAGFLLLHQISGTFSIRELIEMVPEISQNGLFFGAMILILLGAFTKSAQFPFHIWLPDAMEAPTPISAYLHSATMVKAGIYLVARFTPVFAVEIVWSNLLIIVGLITLFWGSFMAIKQTDLKALLAFSTISQLGLIMSLLGVGSNAVRTTGEEALMFSGAILAAVFHLFNHSTFKGSLFMMVGILDHETGTRDIRRLGGLMALMPVSFTLTVIGGLSMAGLPPFSGFLSKEMFFTGVLSVGAQGGWMTLVPIVAWVASILTFVYCMIIVFRTFLGPYRADRLEKPPHEAPLGMLIPPIILASLVLVFFFFPNLLSYTVLEPAMRSILPGMLADGQFFEVKIKAWHGPNMELLMTFGVIVLGALLYGILRRWSGVFEMLPRKLSFNLWFEQGKEKVERWSASLRLTHMTGFLRDYLLYIFIFFVVVIGGSLLWLHPIQWNTGDNAPIAYYEYLLLAVMIGAGVVMMVSHSRITLISAVGVIGFLVSLLFVIFRAPDLALTQLVAETISTALFLLVFYYLPKMNKQIEKLRFKLVNLLVSLAVGAVVILVGLSALGHRLVPTISGYFEDSYKLAGAKNMVNAILVDFRAFDTMMEIVVLFTAGIGVYTLIKLNLSEDK